MALACKEMLAIPIGRSADRFEEETTMRRLHPILIVIGFRLRANAPEGQKRFPISFLTTFALCAGLVLFPARAKAAYVATELGC